MFKSRTRLVTVVSPIRPLAPETLAAVCLGLTLTGEGLGLGFVDLELWEFMI